MKLSKISTAVWLASLLWVLPVPMVFADERDFVGRLEQMKDDTLARQRPPTEPSLREADFIVVYYSAMWCGACDSVEARLKALYKNAEFAPHFAVVMVSHDFDEARWKEHASKVPWSTVRFAVEHHKHENPFLSTIGRRALPGLILCASDGTVLAETYLNGKWVGPDYVISELRKRIRALSGSSSDRQMRSKGRGSSRKRENGSSNDRTSGY